MSNSQILRHCDLFFAHHGGTKLNKSEIRISKSATNSNYRNPNDRKHQTSLFEKLRFKHLRIRVLYSLRASDFETGASPVGWGVRRTNFEFKCEALLCVSEVNKGGRFSYFRVQDPSPVAASVAHVPSCLRRQEFLPR